MEKLLILKIGGSIIDHDEQLDSFLSDFSRLPQRKILIHGGGLIASRLSSKLGIEVKMHQGRRITDQESIDVVTMVYGGLINKKIVAKLQALNCRALGLSGADGGLIQAHKRPAQPIDYGFVGDIDQISAELLVQLVESELTVVLAPISCSPEGQLLNTNADTIAAAICQALTPYYHCSLLYIMDHPGVLRSVDDPDSLIAKITKSNYLRLVEEGVIGKGMLPKLENAFLAKEAGASLVKICDVKSSIAICLGDTGWGTELA